MNAHRTCAREGCDNSLEGMRSQARWCSEWCRSRQRYSDAKETRGNPVYGPQTGTSDLPRVTLSAPVPIWTHWSVPLTITRRVAA